jgi:hypothetical protein
MKTLAAMVITVNLQTNNCKLLVSLLLVDVTLHTPN